MIRADAQNSKRGALFNGRLTIFTLPIIHHVDHASLFFLRVKMHVKVPDNNNLLTSPKPVGKVDYCSLYTPEIRKRG